MTVDELIDETKLLKCYFGRDELFLFIILQDGELAEQLKAKNALGKLEYDDVYNREARSKQRAAYYYSN